MKNGCTKNGKLLSFTKDWFTLSMVIILRDFQGLKIKSSVRERFMKKKKKKNKLASSVDAIAISEI